MNNELAEWIVKAIETIKGGIADKLEKDDVKVYQELYRIYDQLYWKLQPELAAIAAFQQAQA